MAENFKVGERVRFLRERQEGVVHRIISASRLEVLVDDFVEMEVDAADVVRINASESIFRKEESEKSSAPATQSIVEREPTFVIQRNADKDYALWVLNHSRRDLFFTAYQKVHGKFKGLNAAALLPGERRMIAQLSTHTFHMVQSLVLQVLQYAAGDRARPLPMFSMEIDCKAEVLNKPAEVIPDVGSEGWEFVMEEKTLAVHVEEEKKPLISFPAQGPEVVDLHIERLVDNLMGIGTAQMIQIQLEHFEKKITDAQVHKAKSMVFIHGSGSGKLRKAIHERLRYFKFVKSFEQADPLRYGNGATIVFF